VLWHNEKLFLFRNHRNIDLTLLEEMTNCYLYKHRQDTIYEIINRENYHQIQERKERRDEEGIQEDGPRGQYSLWKHEVITTRGS
jgi:hypothetical protein